MMLYLLNITLLLKRFSLILRALGIGICIVLLFEAVPDLIFNFKIKNIQTFTEEQVIKTNKAELPRYLKISDVEPIGEMYVEELSYNKKRKDTIVTAIIYPAYNLKKSIENLDQLKRYPCYIIVRDSKINKNTIKNYFNKKNSIEGKYNQSTIDPETRNLLLGAGYNIDKNCILLEKGSNPWGIEESFFYIIFFGILGILILLSLLPISVIYKVFKQEERFIRLK
ncbi:hypothetical protein [Elizabethkingia anophelis]|uniref:hypothetical protein n=1 Tax=Elizabethkingia anophelis TaxID=1117645 RepID=UPI00103E96F3|nr:hypothetical protein [Elizabethkingia anophelis]